MKTSGKSISFWHKTFPHTTPVPMPMTWKKDPLWENPTNRCQTHLAGFLARADHIYGIHPQTNFGQKFHGDTTPRAFIDWNLSMTGIAIADSIGSNGYKVAGFYHSTNGFQRKNSKNNFFKSLMKNLSSIEFPLWKFSSDNDSAILIVVYDVGWTHEESGLSLQAPKNWLSRRV